MWNLHPTIVNGIHASIFINDSVECRDSFPSFPPSHLQIRGNVVQFRFYKYPVSQFKYGKALPILFSYLTPSLADQLPDSRHESDAEQYLPTVSQDTARLVDRPTPVIHRPIGYRGRERCPLLGAQR